MNPLSPWKYVNKGLAAILGLFIIATLTAVVFLQHNLYQLNAIINRSGRSVSAALILHDLFIHVDDAEAGARGYTITGEPSYLISYNEALKQVPGELARIESNDNLDLTPKQKNELKSIVNKRIAMLKNIVAGRQAGSIDEAQALIMDSKGMAMTKELRGMVMSLSNYNISQVASQKHASQIIVRKALAVAITLTILVVGLCALLAEYFQRTIRHERALENTKSEFLSLASHQLRTPATNVKQYVGMLLDGYLGELTEQQKKALRVAYKNNDSEIRIMNDLLDVAKLDLKRIHLHKQSVNVVSLVTSVVKEYEETAKERNLSLVIKAPPEPFHANLDRTYFKGVIEKLIDNAIKYSRDNSRIVIRMKANEEENLFRVTVRDRGMGIQKRELSKLFTKFSRLTNERSANSEGSGLGLYWVKEIMELHGGSVSVVSKEVKGSRFSVKAPIR